MDEAFQEPTGAASSELESIEPLLTPDETRDEIPMVDSDLTAPPAPTTELGLFLRHTVMLHV